MQRGFSSILVVTLMVIFLCAMIFISIQNIRDANNSFLINQKNSYQIKEALTNSQASSKENTLANPASVNCQKQDGTLSIQTLPNGGEYGVCNFEDNQSCEEWALFYGHCPVGGVKTIGYDTLAQIYCAQLGGQTLAVKDAKCTLPDGKVCNNEDLYNGKCSIN